MKPMLRGMIASVLFLCVTPTAFAEKVDINTADAMAIAAALKGKGIGPGKAAAIVKYRTEKGPFKTLEDLDKVPGIGAKTLSGIAADVTFGGASAPSVPSIPSTPPASAAPALKEVPKEKIPGTPPAIPAPPK